MSISFPVTCCSSTKSVPGKYNDKLRFSTSFSFAFKPMIKKLQDILEDVPQTMKMSSLKLLDAFIDYAYEFVDQPLLPSQSNFAPVEELGEAVDVLHIEGSIPDDFPEGVYLRNGPNPLFGGLKSAVSMFGRSNHIWVEGEGMLHALYFSKASSGNSWNIFYRNRYVESGTFKLEKKRNKPSFLPATEGDSPAVFSAHILNLLRFGMVDKYLSNTNVLEFCGRFFATAENHVPQEIDIVTLEAIGNWDVDGTWNRPFTSHPKKVPFTGELVIFGIYPQKPYYELGIISADGKEFIHKLDIGLSRCTLAHDIGVTQRYNVIMDFPLTIDINRLIGGGSLIKYEKEGYARIGVMPRYGNADSIRWFEVEPCSAFHILNCFEDGEEVVVRACRARGSVIPGPEYGKNRFEYFSRGFKHIRSVEENGKDSEDGLFFTRVYEWRLSMQSGEGDQQHEEQIKVEYHKLPEDTFCSGTAFVPKCGGLEEDDGYIITFVHNERTNISEAYIVDAKKFSSEPIAKIPLPSRVPYGFHGAFVSRTLTMLGRSAN